MPWTGGDIAKLTHRLTYRGQRCVNVYHYVAEGAQAATAAEMAQLWWDAYKAVIRAFQFTSSELLNDEIRVDEVGGGLQTGVYTVPVGEKQGLRSAGASDIYASFAAIGVRQTVNNRLTRPGQKRLVGLLESDVGAGQIVLPATVALAKAYLDEMIAPLVNVVPTLDMQWSIVKFAGDGTTVLQTQPVAANVVNSLVTSQVSRKERPAQ